MRIAIFGAGAVGGYFGGRLALRGEHEVVFIARGAHLRAIQGDGVHVQSIRGDFHARPALATDDPSAVGPVDAVFVAVKTWMVSEAAEAIQPLIGRETFVVPLENGVEAPGQLAAVLGKEHVLGGMCRIFSEVVAPGRIRHFGSEPLVVLGELDRTRSERAERLRAVLERAGVTAQVPPDIQAAMWEKLLFVGPVGLVGAATRAPLGVIRTLPETRRLLTDAMAEVVAVARSQGVYLPEDAVAKSLAYGDASPPEATSSMQRDIMEGRPSELEAQAGVIVRLGRAGGTATPVHDALYTALLPQERRARGETAFPG
jgi:2-dehydropantoate 2-reductase